MTRAYPPPYLCAPDVYSAFLREAAAMLVELARRGR